LCRIEHLVQREWFQLSFLATVVERLSQPLHLSPATHLTRAFCAELGSRSTIITEQGANVNEIIIFCGAVAEYCNQACHCL
jgi:hypothetical protein